MSSTRSLMTFFDFMGASWDNMTRRQKQQWKSDFGRYYMQAHSKALEAEYDFIAQQVSGAINGCITISRTVAAAVDPNRNGSPVLVVENPGFRDCFYRD